MIKFSQLPVRRKMLVMTFVICGVILAVTIAILTIFQFSLFRSSCRERALTRTAILAYSSTAALAFNNPDEGMEILSALAVDAQVVSASMMRNNESVFACYGKRMSLEMLAKYPAPGQAKFLGNTVLAKQPVLLKGRPIGYLLLEMNFSRAMTRLLRLYGLITLAVVLVSLAIAYYFSGQLQRYITEPIQRLAQLVSEVGRKKDYSLRAIPQDSTDELGLLTNSFNEMLGHIQEQDAALQLSQQKMEALINSINGIVWERRIDDHCFTFVSQQAEKILGYPVAEWLVNDKLWINSIHPDDRHTLFKRDTTKPTIGQTYHQEYRMVAASGKTVWILESGVLINETAKGSFARGIFMDVTQAKNDASNLEKLNRELIDASHVAGMAEVATGVLHNVGNVLNSTGVSANIVIEILQRSSFNYLATICRELNNNKLDLTGFMAGKAGQNLAEYLTVLSEHLRAEHEELVSETKGLLQSLSHIKEIIASQQANAKVIGRYENISPADIVEDALLLAFDDWRQENIRIERNFNPEAAKIRVNRGRLLSVLINLLTNARQALAEGRPAHPSIHIAIFNTFPDLVSITVSDNGIGIAKDDLNRIFSRGFTTKRDGHGFGLESGVYALKEMGGSLSAVSEGIGKGAKFTVLVPTVKPQNTNESGKVTS